MTTNEREPLTAESAAYLLEIPQDEARVMLAAPDLCNALNEMTAFVAQAVEMGVLNADEMKENGILRDAHNALAKAGR